MHRRVLVGSLASALLAAPAAAQELTLEDVLANYYEAIGGLEAWKSVQSMKLTGRMTMRAGMEAPFTQTLKRPGKIRVEFTMQGMTAIRAYDGATAWMLMPFRGSAEPEVMPPEMAGGLIQDADIDGPLVGYEEDGHQLELAGLTETEGTPAYKLEVTLKGGEVEYWYLDAEYFIPIRIEGTREFRGNVREFATTLSDYKEVGGLMIAHSIQTGGAGPGRGMVETIDQVELNVEVDDAIFAMPGGG